MNRRQFLYEEKSYICEQNRIDMKKISLLINYCLLLVMMVACSSGPVGKRATGMAYEVVVVMDKTDWEAPVGEAIKKELTSDVPGLPQSEPALRVTSVTPNQFDGLLTYVRNILIVKVDPNLFTKVSLNTEYDRWADGQIVVTLNAPSADGIMEYINTNPEAIVSFFCNVERDRAIALLKKHYSTIVMEKLANNHELMLNAPEDMTYYRDTTDFFWTSNNAATGRTDIVVYTFPYTEANTFTAEYLVAKRDSIMKVNMPGAFPNSYMTTETRFGMIEYKAITVNGKYCGELRGLWRMVGDMMGGPFVSHARLDEKNNRVVVAECFVYAPETDKRNFIRRGESALYTLLLPEEFEGKMENGLHESK